MATRREHTRYALRAVLASWAGLDLKVNVGESDFITVKRKGEKLSSKPTATGDVVLIESEDDRGDVTVTLSQNSSLNAKLQALFNQRAVGSFRLADLNGSVQAEAELMWITNLPEVKRGKETADYVWTFECAELVTELAGATPLVPQQGV